MDMNALRVFNSLYNLRITEKEFVEIEEEQRHTERTGISIFCVKKDKFIGVSHDENHQIVIKEATSKIKPKPKSRILFKTLVTFDGLPQEIYTLHQIAQYRALDTEIKYVANTIEELKDRICDRFVDGYPKELGEMFGDDKQSERVELVERQIRALYWLFGENPKSFKEFPNSRRNIARIIKVFSRNNRRLALIQQHELYDERRGNLYGSWYERINKVTFKIATFTPKDSRYNFVSPNREIFFRYDCSIWLHEDLFEKVSCAELKVLSRRLEDEEWILLTADEYNKQQSGIRIEMMSARREQGEEKAHDKLMNSIEKQFKKNKVVRHGITFTKKSVSYENIQLKGDKVGEYLEMKRIIYQDHPDFNSIFEEYVEYILNLDVEYGLYTSNRIVCNFNGKQILSIKNIDITIDKRGKNIYVNGYKICKNDVCTVVKSAITNSNQQTYEEYIKSVSKTNLTTQHVLDKGYLSFELNIDQTDDNCLINPIDQSYEDRGFLLSIPFRRHNNKNYVTIGQKEYSIKNTKALLDIGKKIDNQYLRSGHLQRTIKLLYQAIEGITAIEIGQLIKNGQTEYKKMVDKTEKDKVERIARSKDFIANAVRLTNAKRVDGGYFVKSQSGTLYFVEYSSLHVYTIVDGKKDKYLCIVDNDYSRNDDEAVKNDRIAKRLLMLSKDETVAKEIYDRGDKVDKHWSYIQEDVAVA
ncbi:hypothetical protein ACFL54_09055 [Planctomycetota bacterium]